MSIRQKLLDAGVKFTTAPTKSNGFNGTRYDFPSLSAARKAEKATSLNAKGGRGNWHISIY